MAERAYDELARYLRSWGPVPDAEFARARAVFRPATAGRRELLVRAGDLPNQVHFITSGLVRIYYVDEAGVERTKAFRGENHLVCAFSAALRGEPSRVFVEALEPSTLLVASREGFEALRAGHPCWQNIVSRITEWLFVEEERLRWDLLTNDATTRYRNFLTQQPELVGRLTQRQVASFLAIAPESLSRIRALM